MIERDINKDTEMKVSFFTRVHTRSHIHTHLLHIIIFIFYFEQKKYNLYSDCKVRIIAYHTSKSNRSILTSNKIP